MSPWWLVCLGAAAGAPARYLLDRGLQAGRSTPFAVGTLTVNLLGSLLLGVLLGAHDAGAVSLEVLLLLGTGFCGAFTTCSAFAVELVGLGRRRLTGLAVLYAVGAPAGALAGVALGYVVGRAA